MTAEFGLLGELRLTVDEAGIPLGGHHQRALLARLLVSRNKPVPRDALVTDLYPEARSASKALQVGVSRLRAALACSEETDGRLRTTGAGYELRVGVGELDVDRFESLLTAGTDALAAGAAPEAAARLEAAIAVWRGPALTGLSPADWTQAEIGRLEERRLHALELRYEAELALGMRDGRIAELMRLVESHPARERLRGMLMRALYFEGRQAEALSLFRDGRRHLVEHHGIEPGVELRELHQAILAQDLHRAPRLEPGKAPPGPAGLPPTTQLPARLRDQDRSGPFVGRAAESAALGAALERCAAGDRVAAFLAGEPGIGKTRLAVELAHRAGSEGFAVLAGRCDEDLERPFQSFAEAFAEIGGNAPDGLLRAHEREHGAVLARLVPGLGNLLDTRPRRGGAADPADDLGVPGSRRYSLFAAVGDLLTRIGSVSPVLLVLEDLQWADRSTLLLLKHLLTTPAAPRLAILGTYRLGELAPQHPLKDVLADLHREPGVLRLELEGLLDAEVAQLLGELPVGGEDQAGAAVVSALRRSTGGNPFFLTEMVRGLEETHGEEWAQWLVGDEVAELALPLPGGVREMVSRRVHRLGGQTASCLSAAAVLGMEFDPHLLARVLDSLDGEVLDALEAARAAALIGASAGGMAFRHALIAQTLYEELAPARRAELHRRAGRALEDRPDPEAARRAPELAHHWIRAGRPPDLERATHWARRAGDQAASQLAPEKAQRWYEEALKLHAEQPDPSEQEHCALLVELGGAQRHSGDPAFRETLLEAARIAHRRGDRVTFVRAALGNTRGFVSAMGEVDHERLAVLDAALETVGPAASFERARLLATLGAELSFSEDWQRRSALSDEALSVARETGDQETLVHVLIARNITIWRPETLPERLANTAECRQAADLLGDPLARFQALHWRATACVQDGAFAEARSCLEQARRLIESFRQPTALWMSACDDADLNIIAGRLEEAERQALEAMEIGQASGQPDAEINFASELIVIRHDQGRLGELTDLIAQTLESNPRLTGYRSVLALAYCEERRYDEAARLLMLDAPGDFAGLARDLSWLSVVCVYAHVAARLLPQRFPVARAAQALRRALTPWHEQIAFIGPAGGRLVSHHLGMLELALGDAAAARKRLSFALRQAEQLPAPIWAERTRIELARCLLATGAGEQAMGLLRQALRSAHALGCEGLVREADELLTSS